MERLFKLGFLYCLLGVGAFFCLPLKAEGPKLDLKDINSIVTGLGTEDPAVAVRPDGGFLWRGRKYGMYVVVYRQNLTLFAQRYWLNNEPVGNAIRVAEGTGSGWTDLPMNPDVAMDAQGGFVVTWRAGQSGIRAQRYEPYFGFPVGEDIFVGDSYSAPKVAVDQEGNFGIVWATSYAGRGQYRIYSKDGTPKTEVIPFNNSLPYTWSTDIAMNPTGEFVIVWAGSDGSDWSWRPYYLLASADGSITTSGAVSMTPQRYIPNMSVAKQGNGDFVVAWNTSDGFLYAQRHDATGLRLGSEIFVGHEYGLTPIPGVAVDKDGNFVVTWSGEAYGRPSIFRRRYGTNGLPFPGTDQEPINGAPASYPERVCGQFHWSQQFQWSFYETKEIKTAIDMTDDGDAVVVWEYPFGFNNGVRGRRLNAGWTSWSGN